MGPFSLFVEGKQSRNPCIWLSGSSPMREGRPSVFWLFGAEGESASDWKEVPKDLKQGGVQRARIFLTDVLPGLEEAIKSFFPEAA
jgi:transposase-like protein